LRRLTAVALIIAVTLVGCSTPAAAQTPPAPTVTAVTTERACSPVAFPYRAHDVHVWWNCNRDPNIDRPTALRLTWYLNAVVLNRVAAYLTAVDATQQEPHAAVHAAAIEFGIDPNEFARVIGCESNFDRFAVNSTSGALGLGQHLPQYWGARAAALGYPYSAWSNARANARVSAWLWRTSGPQHWVCY
jgi:soluble lytic murein transglycosylase-like protein